MRKRIYEIIEVGKDGDCISKIYDVCMMIVIVISLIPLAFKEENAVFNMMEGITVAIFIIDYLLRLITADYKLGKGKISFMLYPFSVMALIDLISILPSFIVVNKGIKMLRIARLIRTFRVFRVFKGFRYSKNVDILVKVFKRQKDSLTIVAILAVGYILVTALIMFNVEPDTYNNFFDAIYWATVSLTTVGYGDIYAVSDIGKVITMISSLFGIAIVALPAGIITAGYMEEIGQNKEKDEMLKVKFYDSVDDSLLKFAVIISKSNGKWVFCKHKERDTYEAPGGHREAGEDILETAKRELQEETGAVSFEIKPVCVYSVTGKNRVNETGEETFGLLCYAEILEFSGKLDCEMEKVVLMDELPENWTYPLIQPKLIEEYERRAMSVRKNEAIYTRRSIRKYEEKPISNNILKQIIDAGRVAPSAKNRQPWKYLVYSGKAKEQLLAIMREGIENEEMRPELPLSVSGIPDAYNTLRIMESAPIVIIVFNTNGKSPFAQINADDRFTEMNDLLSIGASIENMLLEAEKLNVGSLWIGNTCFAYQKLIEYIGLDAELVGAIALGYKAEKPSMRPRKRLEDIVEYYT